MTSEEAAELGDWLRELWAYVLDLADQVTALGERIVELEHHLDDH